MDRYVYQNPETGIAAIVCPESKEVKERELGRTLSDAEYDALVYDHSILRPIREGKLRADIEVKKIPDKAIPQTREFRDAWVLSDKVIIEDLEKSKAIKLKQVRAERELLMKDLDTAFQRALEVGDEAERARVVAEKQKLRDVTEVLKGDVIKSVDELRGKKIEDFLNAS